MAIEIRELLIRARVAKTLDPKEKFVTTKDLKRIQRKIYEECMDKLRDELDSFRSSRF